MLDYMMEDKICAGCGRIMQLNDYKKYNSYPDYCFERRKWCSNQCRLKNCSKNQAKRKKWNMELEHNQKIVQANEILGGEIVGVNGKTEKGKIQPDIIKENKIFEVEILGNHAYQKFFAKYKDYPQKKVLVISIREELKKLFDEVYLMDNIKNL